MRFGAIAGKEIIGFRPQINVSGSKSLAASDFGTHQLVDSASPVTVTVPKDATLDADIGTEVEISWSGAGSVTINQEDAAVNIRRYGSNAVTGHVLVGQYSACVLRKVAPNEWVAHGAFSVGVVTLDAILLTYQLASGTDSGASTGGAWNTFPLNTELLDTGNYCTLSSNQLTLAAGTYEFFDTRFRVFAEDQTNIRLRNISDSVNVAGLACQGSFNDSATAAEGTNAIAGRFEIAAPKTFEIQIYCTTGRATLAWGNPANAGVVEVYGTLGLRRLY